jgi:hypothetical protein
VVEVGHKRVLAVLELQDKEVMVAMVGFQVMLAVVVAAELVLLVEQDVVQIMVVLVQLLLFQVLQLHTLEEAEVVLTFQVLLEQVVQVVVVMVLVQEVLQEQ